MRRALLPHPRARLARDDRRGVLERADGRDAPGAAHEGARRLDLRAHRAGRELPVLEVPADLGALSAEEFAAGHVAGAKHIPLADLGTAKGLPGNKKLPLIVVCASGQRAAKAAAELKKLGHENVQPLAGGLKAWREANLPIEKA